MSRSWPSFIGALALAMPSAPVAANALSVALCGLPGVTLTIPLGDGAPMPANHSCCKGACHAGCERKQGRRNSERAR
ncbi:MAG: hypothetical protein ABL874_03695 [Sphingopyxis sp.]